MPLTITLVGDPFELQRVAGIRRRRKVERILSAMKQSGQAARESAWRIAMESWLKSRGYIKTKGSPNFPSFLAHE
jgi:hypothetical protein